MASLCLAVVNSAFSGVECSLASYFNRLCFVQFKHRFPSVVFVAVWDPDLYLLWIDYITHILKNHGNNILFIYDIIK